MPETHADPLSRPLVGKRTNFPVVPVKDIPAPGPSDAASADRPVVLVVDEDVVMADFLAEILNRSGYTALVAYDGVVALETALLMPPQLAILGAGLSGESGIELAIALRSKLADCRILLLADQSAKSTLVASAKKAGHKFDVLDITVRPDELLAFVAATFKSRNPAGAASTL
jgi:DNA-binding response OmpR family regulator